jgi:endonuclease G
MIGPDRDFKDRLFDPLLSLPALDNPDNRSFLLRHLPAGPVAAIGRNTAKLPDLHNIIEAAAAMGQLVDTGEWALAIVTRNALQLARGTEPGKKLEALLGDLEAQPTGISPAPIPEIVIGPDERLPISFLQRGLTATRAVVKVCVRRVRGGHREVVGYGTGWMIAPTLLITNYHVIQAGDGPHEPPLTEADLKAQAVGTTAWFDFTERDVPYFEYACTELVHYNKLLDYALLRLAPNSLSERARPLTEWGHLVVLRHRPSLVRGHRLNIIQHPLGGPKLIAIRSNFYYDSFPNAAQPDHIRYLTDTEPGASGSPVFDDSWQVVALHHASVRVRESQYKGEVVKWNNQGILIHAILDSLPDAIRREIHVGQQWL